MIFSKNTLGLSIAFKRRTVSVSNNFFGIFKISNDKSSFSTYIDENKKFAFRNSSLVNAVWFPDEFNFRVDEFVRLINLNGCLCA